MKQFIISKIFIFKNVCFRVGLRNKKRRHNFKSLKKMKKKTKNIYQKTRFY